MVTIITGDIDSGKTTRMKKIYNRYKMGDGFILKKVFNNGKYVGQHIIKLSTGQEMEFSYKKEFIPEEWDEKYCYDMYSFSKKGMDFAQNIILDAVRDGICPIFIDEIGPLELKEQGFYSILMLVLKMKTKVYISVRRTCLSEVLKKFEIKKFKIIKI